MLSPAQQLCSLASAAARVAAQRQHETTPRAGSLRQPLLGTGTLLCRRPPREAALPAAGERVGSPRLGTRLMC